MENLASVLEMGHAPDTRALSDDNLRKEVILYLLVLLVLYIILIEFLLLPRHLLCDLSILGNMNINY